MHILGFQECKNIEVIAVCQRTRTKAQTVAKEFNIPNVFTDYKDLLRLKEIDAVSISTPPYLHYRMVTDSINLGKHVLCEKPFAMNVSEAKEMYLNAEKAGITHMIGFEFRYIPAVNFMKQLINKGYVGNPFHVYARVFAGYKIDSMRTMTWRENKNKAGIGVLGDLGVHTIDTLRWMLGDFKRVIGLTNTFVKNRKLPNLSS